MLTVYTTFYSYDVSEKIIVMYDDPLSKSNHHLRAINSCSEWECGFSDWQRTIGLV